MNRQKIITVSEKVIEYGFYGLIFFLPISKALIESCAGFVFLGFVVNKAMTRDFTRFKTDAKIFWLLFALFVFSALSLINSGPFLAKGFKALFFKWGEYFFLFMIAVDHFKDRKLIKRFFYVFAFIVTLVGLSALSQRFLGIEFFRGRPLIGLAVTGPFKNPNDLGAYLICCFPVLISLAYWNWKWKRKVTAPVVFFACVILLASILLTISRGAWLGVTIGFLMMIAFCSKKRLLSLVFGIFLCFVFSIPFFRKEIIYSFGPAGDGNRYVIWNGAIDMIRENPFLGKGLGTFMDYFEKYVPNIGIFYAHNCYLQMWAESGIFTLLAFLFLAGFVVFRGARIAFKNREDDFGILLSGLIAGISGFLIASFFDTHLYSLKLSVLFWVMLGVTVSIERVLLEKKV
ncbi:MAG: O-antigen ligase family protein [Candidatus Aceula meridiana]|nr:O-antigen ligase family protein [Candidatus Aceula meridiana]